MKKSASVTVTLLAAAGMAARAQSRPEPCSAATFNEQACEAAVQNRGYCWNGRWIRLKYHDAFPYYFDAYQEYVAAGGAVSPMTVGSCGPPHGMFGFLHAGGARGGFGATGACHSSAHG
jgi:hypothetical protein